MAPPGDRVSPPERFDRLIGGDAMRKAVAMSLLAIAAVALNAFAAGEGRLAGKITDAVTKQPIPNATIQLVSTGGRNFKQDYKADKDGTYRLLVIDATLPYKVTYSAPGYQPYEVAMKLKLGEVTTNDAELTPAVAAAPPAPKADPAVTAYNEGA